MSVFLLNQTPALTTISTSDDVPVRSNLYMPLVLVQYTDPLNTSIDKQSLNHCLDCLNVCRLPPDLRPKVNPQTHRKSDVLIDQNFGITSIFVTLPDNRRSVGSDIFRPNDKRVKRVDHHMTCTPCAVLMVVVMGHGISRFRFVNINDINVGLVVVKEQIVDPIDGQINSSTLRQQCVGRKGIDTQYCVCNATYCDDLDPITKQPVGTILSFQTSKSGDRFKESQLKFVKQNDHDNADRVVLTLDKSKKFQKIFGIGAAFTDAATINIGSLPKDMSDRVIKDYFSASGVGLSMARIPIAGCDFSTHEYTYDDTKDDYSLAHFALPDEDIKYKIPQINLAKQVAQHGLKLYGSPWNTPHWLNDKQLLKTQPDKQYETWANYFVKFLDEYKKHGIELWGLTMQNEPMSFSSMNFVNASIERDFVKKHLGPALTRAGYTKDKMNLMVYDDGSDKNPMIEYVDTCLSDHDTAKYVTGIAFHCYLANRYEAVDALHKKYPEFFTFMTECCYNFHKPTDPQERAKLGEWSSGPGNANQIIDTFTHYVSGWVEWNLALNVFGNPNKDKKMAGAPLIIDVDKKEYYKNPQFYAIGHFSKFVAPDSVRVELNYTVVMTKNFGLNYTAPNLVESRRDCIARKGKDSPYCVCNTTYCDDLDPIVKQPKGTVLLFETNKRGDRLKQTVLKASTQNLVNQNEKDTETADESVVLTIDKNTKYQKIIGFGGAFTDASGLNLKSMPQEIATNVIKDYFSHNGIEYNMGRVPIAGCDFSPRAYTYNDKADDFELNSFALQMEDLEYKFPYIKLAKNVSASPLKLFASPWSAPGWMKTTGHTGDAGFLDKYKENGIEFWGLTIENEPAAGRQEHHDYNAMGFNATLERDFVKLDLGPALKKAGYGRDKINLMLFDDAWDLLEDWVDTSFNDKETAQYLNGIAYHCYGGDPKKWTALENVHRKHQDQFVISSECCQEFNTPKSVPPGTLMHLGNWGGAESYAQDIMNNLEHWTRGWVEWNLALDIYGHPNWAMYSAEAPILVDPKAKEYYKDTKFYILGQYSKFLAPDSVRVSIKGDKSVNNFESVAFVRPDNGTIQMLVN
ncbi:unnamed protein product [Oppiella nova]|uniref:Glucosylceramidase n=1 Tax=Oppiella nova TaxID=334625 RepID=A0A7R9QCU3_9ACAR|nr:unnamed protein product [Oppiella nova]CAG2163345.1 unnamed protein product [Oppiella nova]